MPSIFLVFVFMSSVTGKEFLAGGAKNHARIGSNEFQSAMNAVLGCGGDGGRERLAEVQIALEPMWRTLPKDGVGKVEWRTLRYMAHRYFMQQSNLLIRGFEPNLVVNAPHEGHAAVLNNTSPHFIERLQEQGRAGRGFSLEDASALVVTLEQLIFDGESALLATVYEREKLLRHEIVAEEKLLEILETYLVHWVIGNDDESLEILEQNRTLRQESMPQWQALQSFASGRIKALNFARQRAAKPRLTHGYTYHDAHEVVGSITKSFASFWESECKEMKRLLVDMDTSGTGRVTLSQFFAAGLKDDWRFGESEMYLQSLGALDQSSTWHGTQVIIPNYLQAASNCIISAPHYLVCCTNECEDIIGEIEIAIGASSALPTEIFEAVGNITSASDDDGLLLKLEGTLATQLRRVAESHGGKVPLHGRLFAQWMHYMFPHECPFPYKAGMTSSLTPMEFGDNFYATDREKRQYVSEASDANRNRLPEDEPDDEESQQWSLEHEELFADYSSEIHAPWEVQYTYALGGLALSALLAILAAFGPLGSSTSNLSNLESSVRVHSV